MIANNRHDMQGKVFGRLTVVEYVRTNEHRKAIWLCECECGNQTEVPGFRLRSGHTQSCGCYHNQSIADRSTKHGLRYTRLYRIWLNMKSRCNNEKVPCYKHYGGRGIKVCEEWASSFSLFYEWATANGYTDTLTIDRVDVNGNYCPENCRWATMKEQRANQRKVK